jgi:hypothetical protein
MYPPTDDIPVPQPGFADFPIPIVYENLIRTYNFFHNQHEDVLRQLKTTFTNAILVSPH